MKASVIRPSELTDEQILIWRQYQHQHAMTQSPFFCPEYVQAVASIRNDIEIGIVEAEGEIVGFFPFERSRWNIAQPVGQRICDFNGILMRSGVDWKPNKLLRHLHLRGWNYTNAPVELHALQVHHRVRGVAPYMDMSDGFEAYCEERARSGSGLIPEVQRKSRRLQRDIGTLRLVLYETDQHVMNTLIQWKSEQRRRTNTSDVLSLNWVLRLLDTLKSTQTEQFGGILSALYAGEQLAAIHFGMRSSSVLHYWFPSFNQELGRYSPGSILALELARTLSEKGIRRIDLGRGGETYKERFESSRLQIAGGSVDRTLSCRFMTAILQAGKQWTRKTQFAEVIHRTKHAATRAKYFTANLLER